MKMKYIVGDYIISLEQHAAPLFSLTVEGTRHLSIYIFKSELNITKVAKDAKHFEALMKKFFEGKYSMQIGNDYSLRIEKYDFQIEKDANGLNLLFKIVVNEILIKEFSLQLPPLQTASLYQLQEEHSVSLRLLQEDHTETLHQMREMIRHLQYVASIHQEEHSLKIRQLKEQHNEMSRLLKHESSVET